MTLKTNEAYFISMFYNKTCAAFIDPISMNDLPKTQICVCRASRASELLSLSMQWPSRQADCHSGPSTESSSISTPPSFVQMYSPHSIIGHKPSQAKFSKGFAGMDITDYYEL